MLLKEFNFPKENIRSDVDEIVAQHRNYENFLLNQITEGTPIILFSDLEGPHLIGDTALDVMKRFIPDDMGGKIYNATYEWYDPLYYKTGLGQEAGDIIMALPLLLAHGVTGEKIVSIAAESGRMKGSDKVIELVKNKGGKTFGITSAWSQHHLERVQEIGMDGLFGTEFPIDEIRARFAGKPRFEIEMEQIRKFTKSLGLGIICETGITPRYVNQLIGNFYTSELGVDFINHGLQWKSIIGDIINQLNVVGDKGKLDLFKKVRDKRPRILVTMGDGLNDKKMLTESEWSIGVNGPDAVLGATIGIVTNDMEVVADVIGVIADGKASSPDEVMKIFRGDDRAIVHLGGGNTPSDLIEKHREMRRKIRGVAANF